MADPFIAEIRLFPFNYAPVGWALCNGQLMPISQNTALFSLLGTTYGGDGRSTFALPDLQGRVPLQWGQGPGLSPHDIGAAGGQETVTLHEAEVPQHTHALQASAHPANLSIPGPKNALARSTPGSLYKQPDGSPPLQQLASGVLGDLVGGNQPHNNLMPYLTLNFCIALQGVFPPRP